MSPRNVADEHGQDQRAAVVELAQEHAVREPSADPDDAKRRGEDRRRRVRPRGLRAERADREQRERGRDGGRQGVASLRAPRPRRCRR